MKIKTVVFRKEVTLGRDVSRVKLENGGPLRGPDWPDGATMRLDFLDGRLAYLLVDQAGKPLSGRLFPLGENVECVIVDADDLAATLARKKS